VVIIVEGNELINFARKSLERVTLKESDRPKPQKKAVIFDIGGVIVRLNLEHALAPFCSPIPASTGAITHKRSEEEIWRLIQSDSRWSDWQEGRIKPYEWYEHITRALGVGTSFEEFCAAWNGALHPQTILPDSLFTDLASRCRLALLSNTDPIHAARLEESFSFVRHFPVRIYSNEVGARKPSATIYQRALAALDVSAAETLYVDDIAEFVEAARELGFDAIQFQSLEQLAGELSRRGLLAVSSQPPSFSEQTSA
jgi:FMN phosphatase YigB (HAD superfamily)